MIERDVKWRAVFFDFDGVIADSVQVKTAAFATMFQPYGPDIVKEVIRYHLENGGMPRHQKIAYYYREYLEQDLDNTTLARLGQEFSNLVVDKVVAAPLIAGALQSLKTLKLLNIPAFVISGTPNDEIQLVIKRKNLSYYFQEVHGSPLSKTEISHHILNRYSLPASACLFIGDALADYVAAKNTGMNFLARVSAESLVIFPNEVALSPVVQLHL